MAKKLFNPKTINKFCSKIEVSNINEKRFDEYWIGDFEESKDELVEVKEHIDRTDGGIDGRVYGVYGFEEEKIKIVEGVVKK